MLDPPEIEGDCLGSEKKYITNKKIEKGLNKSNFILSISTHVCLYVYISVVMYVCLSYGMS